MDFPDTSKPIVVKTVPFKEPIIQGDDILSINIQTIDPQANLIFSQPSISSSASSATAALGLGGGGGTQQVTGYLVDKEGNVQIPIIGKVKLAGLTTIIARDSVTNRLQKFYKDPIVDVRFANFKITVLGEVLKPGAYTVPNERTSILDALGLAGDLTIYGRRENVLLIRDSSDQKQMVRLNLNSKNLISSPYFYLKQSDIVYVEPNKAKAAALDAAKTRNYAIAASIITLLIVVATRVK